MLEKQKMKLFICPKPLQSCCVWSSRAPCSPDRGQQQKTLLICLEFSFCLYNTSVHSSFNLKRCFPTLMRQENSCQFCFRTFGRGGSWGETTALIKHGGHRGTHGQHLFFFACELIYEGGVLKAPQAWKQRVKQWGSFPFRTSRSFLGCSASLERMCWM